MFNSIKIKKILFNPAGFSLPEVVVALLIGSLILIAVLAVYNRTNDAFAAILSRYDKFELPRQVLQLIAEDLDGIIADNRDAKITFMNKPDKDGLNSARLEILRTIVDKTNKPAMFEKIVWQTAYDYEGTDTGMILYRSHSGLVSEDRLLDEPKEDWERQLYIPVCTGVTFFEIVSGNPPQSLDAWSSDNLPENIVVTISFTAPVEIIPGQYEIPEFEKITRTITIDRTKKINFFIDKTDYLGTGQDENVPDINSLLTGESNNVPMWIEQK